MLPEPTAADGNSALALDQLRLFIDGAELQPGAKLPTERELSARFGIGRRALRRALEALEAEGRIWRRQGAGTFLGQPAATALTASTLIANTDFVEIMEVRLRIEPQLAQMAALRARPEEIVRMRDLSIRIAESEDADARELWDGSLHRLIAQAARNTLFLSLFDMVNRIRQDEAWRAIRERARRGRGTRPTTARQHAAIVDAIEARDPAAAFEAMHQHLLLLHEILIHQTSLDGGGLHQHTPDEPAAQA